MLQPFNFKKWIDEHRHLLKPPVNNLVVYKDTEFIIMVVGGPNARKDYHYNEGEEFFYQLEGDMILRIMDNGVRSDIHIKEGEIFLLPPRTHHSPQRFANTIGLVVERQRKENEYDACSWYCDSCNRQLYAEQFKLKDIVKQLPALIQKVYDSKEIRTCSQCGTVMEIPSLNNTK